jgi:hypothetical protein
MHLVQMLLPLYDNAGQPFAAALYHAVRTELTERFGGVTVYSRAPAEGLWKVEDGAERDDLLLFEVMVEELDRAWWQAYREQVRVRFRQDALVVRAHAIDIL